MNQVKQKTAAFVKVASVFADRAMKKVAAQDKDNATAEKAAAEIMDFVKAHGLLDAEQQKQAQTMLRSRTGGLQFLKHALEQVVSQRATLSTQQAAALGAPEKAASASVGTMPAIAGLRTTQMKKSDEVLLNFARNNGHAC